MKITDDNGYHWIWDGTRVYCTEGENKFIEMGIDPFQNGYPAYSEEEAIEILVRGGYIQKGDVK